jgi:hypothetical protein
MRPHAAALLLFAVTAIAVAQPTVTNIEVCVAAFAPSLRAAFAR